MISKCNCCTTIMNNRKLPDKDGFSEILTKKENCPNIDKPAVNSNILFRLITEPDMLLHPDIYIVQIYVLMELPYKIYISCYDRNFTWMVRVCSVDTMSETKIIDSYSNVISNIKGNRLTRLKQFINNNID